MPEHVHNTNTEFDLRYPRKNAIKLKPSLSSLTKKKINIRGEIIDAKYIFETEATICESGEIAITNLYILVKNNKHIKIFIHNITEDTIKIPSETIIKYINTEILLYNFIDIFISENKFGRTDIIQHQIKTGNTINNKFKVATASDITTLEYYQSIYTHCKQQFEIRDGIIAFKKTLFQYIENRINNYLFGNYNITTVKRDLIENILYYSNTESENISTEACATYFKELDYNIIQFCEEKYSANTQFVFELESETETRTSSKLPLTITPFSASLAQAQTPNSPLNRFARPEDFTLLRSPTRQQEPLQTSSNLLDFLTENQSEHSETAANKENNSEITEKESIDSEKEEDEMTTYIAKIPEFSGEDIETSPQEWLNQVTKAGDANGWNAARMLRTIPYFLKRTAGEWFENLNAFKAAFLEQFTDNNTSITLRNCFRNIKQKLFKSVMTYIGKFNKLLRRIRQLETNDYYSDAQILDQFITSLKNKLIKKICSHVPEDLNSVIQHAKRYEMAIEEANRTKLQPRKKLTNSQRRLKTISPINNNSNPKDINHPKDEIKITLHHFPITSLRIAITVESLATGKEIAESYNKTNKIEPTPQPIPQQYQQPFTQHYQQTTIELVRTTNWFPEIPLNQDPTTTTLNPDFHYTALSEGRAATQQQNPSYTPTTIPPARIAENANLSDIFPFEFKANESPFLLSNAATNEQKAIMVIYTEAKVKGKTICLILDSGSAGSIITYQLMQQLKRNVNQPAQTVIVTADGMKKTPVGEIDNFLFTLDGITIPVKVLVMNAPQYQALVGNDWLQKANTNLNWETQELIISYQGQHAWVPAICSTFNKHSEKAPAFEFEPEEEKPLIETFMALGSTSNWAEETEQEHFTAHFEPKTSG
ncbi:hypothetical protein G9A89_010986 [Geosiphon pyriformis]|nr:hypothetical protein G9A89_010986 [Geosiphon pyriformis]